MTADADKTAELVNPQLSNPEYKIINGNQLIVNRQVTNSFFSPNDLKEFLSQYEGIMSRKGRREVYYYFLENVAATVPLIATEVDQSEQAIHKHIKWLCSHGFIVSYGKIKGKKKGGPKPVLYALPEATSEQIARARLKIDKSYRATFTLVKNLTQQILEDTPDQDEDIQYSKIIQFVRKNNQGFSLQDIADQVSREIQGKGFKVWR